MTLLGEKSLWEADEGYVHFIGFKSGLIKRTCRSNFRAETHGMIYGTEASDNIRATISSLRGLFKRRNWEHEVASQLPNLWLTDCQSLRDYLVNPIRAGCEDKRLEIDLDGLREDLGEYCDGSLKDDIAEKQYNKPTWIDTSAMICDLLTKLGNENLHPAW